MQSIDDALKLRKMNSPNKALHDILTHKVDVLDIEDVNKDIFDKIKIKSLEMQTCHLELQRLLSHLGKARSMTIKKLLNLSEFNHRGM